MRFGHWRTDAWTGTPGPVEPNARSTFAARGDWKGLFAPGAAFTDPATAGTTDLRAIARDTRGAFPDWTQEITSIRGGDDWAVFEWIGRATYRGGQDDEPGSGAPIEMPRRDDRRGRHGRARHPLARLPRPQGTRAADPPLHQGATGLIERSPVYARPMFDPSDVAGPDDLGIDPQRLSELLDRARRDVDSGLLPSCQLAVARHGRLAALQTFGDATDRHALRHLLVHQGVRGRRRVVAIGDGPLDPCGEGVADLIPEFATERQGRRHRRAGDAPHGGLPARAAGRRALERPGGAHCSFRRLAAELGARHRVRVPRHVGPLGARRAHRAQHRAGLPRRSSTSASPSRSACPASASASRSTSRTTSPAWRASASRASPDDLEAVFGIRELPLTEVTDERAARVQPPDTRRAGVPGGGGMTRAAELALFYQGLLTNPGDLWDTDVLADATSDVRNVPRPVVPRSRQPHPRPRRGGRRRRAPCA